MGRAGRKTGQPYAKSSRLEDSRSTTWRSEARFKQSVVTFDVEPRCNYRWHDREMVILTSSPQENSCHIVSLNFLRDQGPSIERLSRNLHSRHHCVDGVLEETSSPRPVHPSLPSRRWKRPSQPDLIWFSNGLWELENVKQDTCEQRYDISIRAIHKWRSQGIRVIWQSLFPINHHPHITNEQIDWDYKCQKKLASQEGIEVADLYRTVRTMGVLKVVDSYHLDRDQHYERIFIHPLLDACCGGWEEYYGTSTHLDEEKLDKSTVEFEGQCQRLANRVNGLKVGTTLSTGGKAGSCCDEMWSCLRQ